VVLLRLELADSLLVREVYGVEFVALEFLLFFCLVQLLVQVDHLLLLLLCEFVGLLELQGKGFHLTVLVVVEFFHLFVLVFKELASLLDGLDAFEELGLIGLDHLLVVLVFLFQLQLEFVLEFENDFVPFLLRLGVAGGVLLDFLDEVFFLVFLGPGEVLKGEGLGFDFLFFVGKLALEGLGGVEV
jgi:hypothetical protein